MESGEYQPTADAYERRRDAGVVLKVAPRNELAPMSRRLPAMNFQDIGLARASESPHPKMNHIAVSFSSISAIGKINDLLRLLTYRYSAELSDLSVR